MVILIHYVNPWHKSIAFFFWTIFTGFHVEIYIRIIFLCIISTFESNRFESQENQNDNELTSCILILKTLDGYFEKTIHSTKF